MPFVAFQFRMQAAALRKLSLMGVLRAADGGPSVTEYIENLQRAACVEASKPVFALVQSETSNENIKKGGTIWRTR